MPVFFFLNQFKPTKKTTLKLRTVTSLLTNVFIFPVLVMVSGFKRYSLSTHANCLSGLQKSIIALSWNETLIMGTEISRRRKKILCEWHIGDCRRPQEEAHSIRIVTVILLTVCLSWSRSLNGRPDAVTEPPAVPLLPAVSVLQLSERRGAAVRPTQTYHFLCLLCWSIISLSFQ